MLWLRRYLQYCQLAPCSLSAQWWHGTSNANAVVTSRCTKQQKCMGRQQLVPLQTLDCSAPLAPSSTRSEKQPALLTKGDDADVYAPEMQHTAQSPILAVLTEES